MAKASAPAAQEAPVKKNRMKLILIITVALLLAVGLTVGGVWFFLLKDKPEQGDEAAASTAPVAVVRQPAVYEELMPPFVVNFQAEGRSRYMQVSLALMARDPQQLANLKVHMPALRNQLVMLFSSQDYAELNTPLGLDMLKQKVTASVQQLAMRETGFPVVEQVLFTNFVMQ